MSTDVLRHSNEKDGNTSKIYNTRSDHLAYSWRCQVRHIPCGNIWFLPGCNSWPPASRKWSWSNWLGAWRTCPEFLAPRIHLGSALAVENIWEYELLCENMNILFPHKSLCEKQNRKIGSNAFAFSGHGSITYQLNGAKRQCTLGHETFEALS